MTPDPLSSRSVSASDTRPSGDPRPPEPPATIPCELPPTDAAPSRIGRFDILELVGQGAMGRVYRARDTQLLREVALKVLRGGTGSIAAREQFLLEARNLARLQSQRVVPIYSAEEIDGSACLVMPLLKGESLAARLERGRLSRAEADRLAREIVLGLADLHAADLIHRDLKPANVWIDSEGRVLLMDLGLASAQRVFPDDAVAGTPSYMSPEQAAGGPLDARSDLFALGAVYAEMLTGRRLFPGRSPQSALRKLIAGVAPGHLRTAGVGTRRRRLLNRLLARDPEARPADADAVRTALRSVRTFPLRVAFAALAALAIAFLLPPFARRPASAFPDLNPAWVARLAESPAASRAEILRDELARRNPGEIGKCILWYSGDGRKANFHTTAFDLIDLTPLRAVPGLVSVECYGELQRPGRLANLAPLRGLSLVQVGLSYNPIEDLSPLEGMPLRVVYLSEVSVLSFSPIERCPLDTIHATSLRRVAPSIDALLDRPLEEAWINPEHAPEFDRLRRHPTLKTLNDMPVEAFWSMRTAGPMP